MYIINIFIYTCVYDIASCISIVLPSMIIKLNKYMVKEIGHVVNLTCLASGDPPPFYTWTKNGLTIDGQLNNDSGSLVLSDVTSADDGLYTCWAVNEAGNISTATNLTIHGESICTYQ